MRMIRTALLGLTLCFGLTAANAALPVLHAQDTGDAIVKVGEGCGANRWRDRFGNCHWFGGPGGVARGTRFECPPGTHIGPEGGRCWPNG